MAENPIKYSDLIQPDDSIEKLIGQLERLQSTYDGIANSVRVQAAAMASSLRSVSGATSEGRKHTQAAATDADRLAKAYRDLEFAQSDTAKRIAELKEVQKEQNYQNKLAVQSANAVATSYNALSAQYRINKALINNLSQAERENDPAAKKLVEDTKEIYEQMKKMQEATGKCTLNVGNYEQAITSAIGVNTKWYNGIQQLATLFEGGLTNGLKTAGTAVASFGKKLLALLANPIVATIAAIAAAFVALAKGISTSEENTMALNRVLAPFERILTGVVSVLQSAAGFVLKVVEGFEGLAMGASRLMEKLPLVGSAIKKVNDALQENIDLTIRQQELQKAERANTVEQARLSRDVAKYRRDAETTNDPNQRIRLLKMADFTQKKIMLNEIALAKEDLAIKKKLAEQAGNNKETNDALAAAQVRVYNAEQAYLQGTIRMQSKIRNIQNQQNKGSGSGKGTSTTANDETEKEQRLAEEKAKRLLDAERKLQDTKLEMTDDEFERKRQKILVQYGREQEDLRAQLKTLGEDEVETRKAISERIAEIERLKYQKVAEVQQQEFDKIAKKQKEDADRLKADALRKEKEAQEELKKKRQPVDFYDLLGLKLEDEQKAAIDESLQYALDAVNTFMDALVQAAEEKKRLADEEVDRAQRVLEAEIEARANGYANEVETARKELEEAKKNQQKALREQQRAQRAQQAIDTAMQVSSLVTATANIWKAFTGSGPWGVAAAIAATALMWGSFAAAKVQAIQATSAGSEEYGEGTVELLHGGSHQSGNDIDLGRKADGTRRRAEGGEYFAVINKRNSRKFRDLIPDVINSFNDGTFAEKYMGAYGGNVNVAVAGGDDTHLRALSDDVRQIREQGETQCYTDGNGNTVVLYKNVKRITKGS